MTCAAVACLAIRDKTAQHVCSRKLIRYLGRNGDEWFCFVWVFFSPSSFLYYYSVVTEKLNIQVVLGGWNRHILHIELYGTRKCLGFIWNYLITEFVQFKLKD